MTSVTALEVVPLDVVDLIEEARGAERSSRYVVAREHYEAALRCLPDADSAPLASALIRWIGRTYETTSDFEAALDCYEAALAVARASDASADVAHVLNCRGALMFRRGRLEEAKRLYVESRAMAVDAGEWKLVAMVDQNLGTVANVHGDHELARSQYYRSMEQYSALGLEQYVGPLLSNIGRLHTDLGEWREAEAAFGRAIVICEREGDVSHRVVIEVNQARLYLSTHDLRRARVACDDALELSMSLKDDRWLGEIYKNSGVISLESHRPRLAEAAFRRALREAERREDLLLEAEITKEMAHLFHSEKRHPEVLQCLNRAHDAFSVLRARRDLAAVDQAIAKLEESFATIVRDWGDSIESKDYYTQGHCERVAAGACELATAAGVGAQDLAWFRMGALLHDVGKVTVPSEILNEPGPLTDDQWTIMKRHPENGVKLLADVEFPWDIRPMVLHHHEHWDGGGYPHGLKGSEIPMAARILCVADVFDALTTTRSYRTAFSPEAALKIMKDDAGRVFDPELFEIFATIAYRRASRSRPRRLARAFGYRENVVQASSLMPPVNAVA